MSGPRPKPLPRSDEGYVRREVERITSEEASDPRYTEAPEFSEFGPVRRVDEERCEREWTAMARAEDLALYSETGRVY